MTTSLCICLAVSEKAEETSDFLPYICWTSNQPSSLIRPRVSTSVGFFPGGQKWQNFIFPTWNSKQFFFTNFQNPGGARPLSDAHGLELQQAVKSSQRMSWRAKKWAFLASVGIDVATSPGVLRWLCDSPRTGCARRTKIYLCGANKQ